MNKEVIFTIAIFLITVILIILILSLIVDTEVDVITSFQCCDGKDCTDTYYTQEDNQCHLVLCENSPFTNKEDCTYEGANKSIEVLGKL